MLKTRQLILALALCQLILGGHGRSFDGMESWFSLVTDRLTHSGKEPLIDLTATDLICTSCEEIFDNLLDVIDSGNYTYFEIQDHVVDTCLSLPPLGNIDVCEGFLELSMPSLAYVFNHTVNITGNEICGTLFVMLGCTYDNPNRYWEISLTTVDKPVVAEPAYDNSVPIMKVLHLSDTHYDPEYFPGGNANCPEKYLCCRNSSMPLTQEDAAGFWGDYRSCDAPKWLLEEMYQHIVDTHTDIDFIIWTGDLVPHDLWSTTQVSNVDILHTTANMIKDYFGDTPVFPSVGNHEGQPANIFPQPYVDEPAFDISWLYTELDDAWSMWLPSNTSADILYGGFYSTMVLPDLKIISVNSNYCYGFNWWLIMDDEDVAEILDFMITELQASEDKGEKVYIISHHPSGSFDCGRTWSHEYNKIVARYESTITGLFYGHTHKDHFHLFFDPEEPERVYDIGYIAQSQTPYSNLNPGYKIYHIEGDYEGSMHRVIDHENWIMDLDMANTMNVTTFFKLYTARDEYDLVDLSPQSLHNLVQDMAEDGSVYFDRFYRNYVKDGRPLMDDGCDAGCKESILCQLVVSDNSDHSRCDNITMKN